MGIALWAVCGAAAFLIARIVPILRSPQWWWELVAGLLTAVAAGFAATALDFGGWNELDLRGAAFALVCAFAAVGVIRAIRSPESASRPRS